MKILNPESSLYTDFFLHGKSDEASKKNRPRQDSNLQSPDPKSPRRLSRKGYQTALQYLNSLYLALLPGGATPGDYNSATCTAAVPWWQPGRVGGVAGRDYLSGGETGRQVSPAWAAAEEGLQGPMLGWLCCISST